MIRLGVVDDHDLFRHALIEQLEKQDDIDVILQASRGEQLLDYMKVVEPDVLLLDLDLPDIDGLKITETLRDKGSEVKIVALTMIKDRNVVLNLIEAGVNGYLLKESSIDDVLNCIRSLQEKEFYYSEKVSDILRKKYINSRDKLNPNMNPFFDLTKKEIEIIRLVAQEYTNKEIADQLDLTVRSIESYRHRIMEKIGCKNSIGIVKFAIANDLINV